MHWAHTQKQWGVCTYLYRLGIPPNQASAFTNVCIRQTLLNLISLFICVTPEGCTFDSCAACNTPCSPRKKSVQFCISKECAKVSANIRKATSLLLLLRFLRSIPYDTEGGGWSAAAANFDWLERHAFPMWVAVEIGPIFPFCHHSPNMLQSYQSQSI